MYQQTLYTILKDYINPKILKKNNRYKKWKYGYNKEYDFVVISKDGTIGQIYEIQGLKIAIPEVSECFKRSEDKKEQYWKSRCVPFDIETDLSPAERPSWHYEGLCRGGSRDFDSSAQTEHRKYVTRGARGTSPQKQRLR